MILQVQTLQIPDVKVLSIRRFNDERGFFSETYRKDLLAEAGITVDFVQDNQSYSEATGTLRGLHLQAPPSAQAKLVRVVRGTILDVCVDVRRGSPTFGQSVSAEISAEKWNQIFVPIGFLHGFITLQPGTEVEYKVSAHYCKESELGVRWDDPDLKIDWKTPTPPLLSPKDAALPTFREFSSPFEYLPHQ